jgi:pimeloyl-ACP methyl ester carboxylesterase
LIDNRILYKSQAGYEAVMALYDEGLRGWPVPYESRYVDTRYGSTHVLVAGRENAPPLVVFHGWSGSSCGAHVEYDLPTLASRFRLYFVDTIGQSGRSGPNRPPTNGPAYGEWALDLLDSLGIVRAYIAGISGGGYLTLKLASFASKRVVRAFVISTAGILSLKMPLPLHFLLSAIPAMIYPHPTTARQFVRATSSPQIVFSQRREEMAQILLLLFRHHKFQQGPEKLTDDELRRITAPIYILMGRYDITTNPVKAVERAHRLMSHVQTEIVPDAGHVLTFDRQDIVMVRMLKFFESMDDLDKFRWQKY